MVVKVYISGISGNKEVKKRQQRVLMILDSKHIEYDVIDITEPGRESDKEFMQNNSKSKGGTVSDPNPRSPLPPQVFNEEEYCGDYDQFDLANELDTLEQFLKVEVPPDQPTENGTIENGDADSAKKGSKENSQERGSSVEKKPASKENTPAKDGTPGKEGTPAKESTPSKDGTPAKEGTPTKEDVPAKEGTPAKDVLAKEGTPAKDVPTKEGTPAKEGTPVKNKTPSREATPAKEGTPARQSVEKELTSEPSVKSTVASKENTPARSGSREKSVEKAQSESKKNDPSEALIENEQAAASN